MKVAIIVLNWNSEKYVGECLESLRKLDTSNIELKKIVVDNASTDGSVSYLQKNFSDFDLIINKENLGYAEGNNVGIRVAQEWGAEWIWIVNPDIQVSKDSLIQLIKLGHFHPKAGIVGSKVYYTSGFESHPNRYTKSDLGKVIWYAGGKMDWANVFSVHLGLDEVNTGKYDQEARTDFVTGASMFLRSATLTRIGLLDRKYFLYFEENDLCQRTRQTSWELWYAPASVVWHANAQATIRGSGLVDYYTTRNRMLFGMRWAPLRARVALIRESVRLLFSGREWQKKGIVDYYLGRFNKGSYVN